MTAAATAKEYIVAITRHARVHLGTQDADATNDPVIVPVSGSAIDAEVGPEALQLSQDLDPDLMWMSLGDVDRVGHTDPSGNAAGPSGAAPAARLASLRTADAQVRNLLTSLQVDGRWDNTVVLVTADHSMDWSLPNAIVSLTPQFEADDLLAARTNAAQNGGAAIYWLLAPDAPEAGRQLARMHEIALATDGVAEAWYTRPNPDDGADAQFPAMPGAPGEAVDPDVRAANQGENIDMAPTVAWLLGLNPPPGGFDGRVLDEAFSRRPTTRLPVVDVPSIPRYNRIAGPDRLVTAAEISRAAFPDPDVVQGLVVAAAGTFPDALSATPLAAALGGPVLLTGGDSLATAVADEIGRLQPSTVIVVGGTAVIADALVEVIRSLGVETVTRVAGPSRYGTAVAVATAIGELAGDGQDGPIPGAPEAPSEPAAFRPGVILSSGEAFPDALVAGPSPRCLAA